MIIMAKQFLHLLTQTWVVRPIPQTHRKRFSPFWRRLSHHRLVFITNNKLDSNT